MILIDNQKFACSACINGHRSSSCQHTERPLFEIKKKGRPISQCERCRELRKTRSYHSKCLCDKPEEESVGTGKTPGSKRKKEKIPTLPNGIKDSPGTNKSITNARVDSRKRLKATVDSCKSGCDSTKGCKCNGDTQEKPDSGVHHAHTSNFDFPDFAILSRSNKPNPTPQDVTPKDAPAPPRKSCCAPRSPQGEKFSHRDAPIVIKPLSLPPDADGPGLLPSLATWTTPLPSFFTHNTTTTEDGCGCGDGCECAGCAQHRGAVAAAAAVAAGHHSCPDRCGTCQDRTLTTLGGAFGDNDDSSIESLLARAIAKLPPAPPGKLSVFQSTTGGERVALVVLPRSGGAIAGSCLGSDPSEEPVSPLIPRPSTATTTARRKRRIRSPSLSDDGLTDADAEGELDPEIESTLTNKNWGFPQFEVDVDLELGLAADAIST